MSGPVALESLDLAALLCSRVCHDLISPVGAIVNGLEVLEDDKLVGGLYGVHLGSAFFGESMFHRATDASKLALVALVERLRRNQFTLLDTQWMTPHLEQFGTYLVPNHEYLELLKQAIRRKTGF